MANIICINCMKGTLNASGVCTACGKTDEEIKTSRRHLPLRTILRGKYLMGKVIGEGGFGITYLGYDLDLEIRVAIKEFCPRDFAGRDVEDGLTILPFDEESAEFYEKEKDKFINEAKRLAKFRGEQGVVSVLDYFQENGTAYIVMEYIDGITLKKFQKMVGGTMEPDKVLSLMKPIMEGLSKLHASSIIHRDISPDNIMIDTFKQKVYLIDFGTAREVNPEEEHSLSVYKKGGYTPIEQQSRHGKQGPWTDVYALCATIYRCITGTSVPEVNNRFMGDEVIRPSVMGIAISAQTETALLHGLAVKPEERTQGMAQLMEELYGDVTEPAGAMQPMVEMQRMTVVQEDSIDRAEETPVVNRQGQADTALATMTTDDCLRYENIIKKIRKTIHYTDKMLVFLSICLVGCILLVCVPGKPMMLWIISISVAIILSFLVMGLLYNKMDEKTYKKLFSKNITSDTIRMQIYYISKYLTFADLSSVTGGALKYTAMDIYEENMFLSEDFLINYYEDYIVPATTISQREKVPGLRRLKVRRTKQKSKCEKAGKKVQKISRTYL